MSELLSRYRRAMRTWEYRRVILSQNPHDRKNYIIEAIQSVLSQNVSKLNFEIIVVKNFRDIEIDSFIELNGFKNRYTEASSLGEKCILGVNSSSGEIITFLEDDDVYHEGRLQKVVEVFKSGDVVYYHNDHYIIGADGNLYSDRLFPSVGSSYSIKLAELNLKNTRRLLSGGAYFNLSSIAFRKSSIIDKLQGLKGLTVACDNFIFYTALDTGKIIYIDSERLTKYRIHSNNDSVFLSSNSEIIKRSISFLERDILGYNSTLKFVSNSFLQRIVRCRMTAASINLLIIDIENQSKQSIDYFIALKCCLKLRYVQMAKLLVVNLIRFFYPKIGPKIYLMYINRENSALNSMKKVQQK